MKEKISVSIEKSLYDYIEKYKKDFDCSTSKAVEGILTIGIQHTPNKKQNFGTLFKELITQFEKVKNSYEEIEKKRYTKSIPNNDEGIPKV